MKKVRQMIAILTCVLLLVLPILSECFIATHRKHICTGQNCPVCLELHMAEQIIETLKTIYLTAAFCALAVCAFAMSKCYEKQIHRTSDTLITLKVELLD